RLQGEFRGLGSPARTTVPASLEARGSAYYSLSTPVHMGLMGECITPETIPSINVVIALSLGSGARKVPHRSRRRDLAALLPDQGLGIGETRLHVIQRRPRIGGEEVAEIWVLGQLSKDDLDGD